MHRSKDNDNNEYEMVVRPGASTYGAIVLTPESLCATSAIAKFTNLFSINYLIHKMQELTAMLPIQNYEALLGLLTEEFHKKLLNAALAHLSETENPLSYNAFCNGFRELARHVFDHLAPDTEIKKCHWFIPDDTATRSGGVTRVHRVCYLIHGGLDPTYVLEELGIDFEEEKNEFSASFQELNKYVHVNQSTFGTDIETAIVGAERAVSALINIIEQSNDCRLAVARSLEAQIHNEAVSVAISDSLDAVDELATHYSLDDVYVEEIKVTHVDSTYIHLVAYGSIDVQLQYGSNGDLRRGDGATLNESFPFQFNLQGYVDSIEEFEVVDSKFGVDTSSWWEGYYDEN